jgi:hypothetical protein
MKDKLSRPKKSVYTSTKVLREVDRETGEVLSTTEQEHYVEKQDFAGTLTFTKMFFTDLFRIYGLSKGAMVVFIELGGMMRDSDNNIILTAIERKEISDRTGLKTQAIYNATRELVTSGLLKRVVSNVYMVDPNIFAIGNDVKVMSNRKEFARMKAIDMKVRYTAEGREVSVSIQKEGDRDE